MKTSQIDRIVLVNQKVLNMIDNLERGEFKIIMIDEGQEVDVTKDNIKTLARITNELQSVLNIEVQKYLNV